MLLPEGHQATPWVKRRPEVVSALNNKGTRLIGKKRAVAIKEKAAAAKPSFPYHRPVVVNDKKLPANVCVRYLYQSGEPELVNWLLKVYNIERSITTPKKPVIYYLHDGPKRGFVREELLVMSPISELPRANP